MSENRRIERILVCVFCPAVTHFISSSLPHAAEFATCGAGRIPARASSMVQHAYVSLPSNQTGKKHFVCSLSGSQLMWQISLYLPGPTGKRLPVLHYSVLYLF